MEQQQKIIITMTDVTVPIELAPELPGQSAAIPHRQNDRDLTKLYFTGDSLDRIWKPGSSFSEENMSAAFTCNTYAEALCGY